MKIPSEAELIEMEQRASILHTVAGYLDRRAENEYAKYEAAEQNSHNELMHKLKAREFDSQARAVESLAGDVETLIEIARAVRSGEPVRHL